MRDGVVLLRRTEVEPDARQAMKGLQLRAGDVLVVVPQQPAVPRRLIRGERGNEKRHADQPRWPRTRRTLRTSGRLLRTRSGFDARRFAFFRAVIVTAIVLVWASPTLARRPRGSRGGRGDRGDAAPPGFPHLEPVRGDPGGTASFSLRSPRPLRDPRDLRKTHTKKRPSGFPRRAFARNVRVEP